MTSLDLFSRMYILLKNANIYKHIASNGHNNSNVKILSFPMSLVSFNDLSFSLNVRACEFLNSIKYEIVFDFSR